MIKYVLTVQNRSNKAILTNGDISISGSDSMMTLTTNFDPILISIVNYSTNLPHISSSHRNRFVQRAVNWDIGLIHTLCFV